MIRLYLRGSTTEQNASRAKEKLTSFIESFDKKVASYYIENASGNLLDRKELTRLLEESHKGDLLVVESIDRLTRLDKNGWKKLKSKIAAKEIVIVSMDLPTSHIILQPNGFKSNELINNLFEVINNTVLDMLAIFAYKDYEDRRDKQKDGIKIAKAKGKYRGRKRNYKMEKRIVVLSQTDLSIADIAESLSISERTVTRARKKFKNYIVEKVDVTELDFSTL